MQRTFLYAFSLFELISFYFKLFKFELLGRCKGSLDSLSLYDITYLECYHGFPLSPSTLLLPGL